MRPVRAAVTRHRRGMTMTEMVVSIALATLLMILLATTWATFGRPAAEVEARARLEQEGILIARSLACDLGGFLADNPAWVETMTYSTPDAYQYQSASPPWDANAFPELRLSFSGAGTPPSGTITIRYWLDGHVLKRENLATQAVTPVARYVAGFQAAPVNSNQVQITATVAYPIDNPRFQSTFTLIGVPPQ